MKLKLDDKPNYRVLNVSGTPTLQQTAILRAGVQKLLGASEKPLVVDFSGLEGEPPAEVLDALGRLKRLTNNPSMLIISGPVPEADQPDVEAAAKQVESPLSGLLAEEARLQARVRKLDELKSLLEKKLSAVQGGADRIKEVKRENSDLRRAVARLESAAQTLYHGRKGEPARFGTMRVRASRLEKILNRLLKEKEVLAP